MKARGIFPTLSGGFDVKPVTSKRSAKVTFSFTWSSAPLILQTDEIVVAFRGADSKSRYLPMDIYDTRLVARYFNGSVQTFLTEKKMIDKGNYATGKAWLGVRQEYARIIHGNVWVRTQSLSKNLASLKVAVGYGHTTIGVSASANVTASSAGLGVDFSVKQSEEYYETKTYRY